MYEGSTFVIDKIDEMPVVSNSFKAKRLREALMSSAENVRSVLYPVGEDIKAYLEGKYRINL